MRCTGRFYAIAVCVGILAPVVCGPASVRADDTPVIRLERSSKFRVPPNVPKCITASPYRGNPVKGPSLMLARVAPGCVVPWHWHPFNETLMTVSGTIENQLKGGATYISHQGDYLFLPAHHPHRAMCKGPDVCTTFLLSEGSSGGYYIDAAGHVISLKAALTAAMSSAAPHP